MALDPALGVEARQLVVEGPPHRPSQLARPLRLVRDPADDVAAPEPLGVLEGPDGERLAGPQVEQLEDDRRRSHVERDPDEPLARGVHVLVIPADAAVPDRDGRIDLEGRAGRRHQDLQAAAEDDELEVSPRRAGRPPSPGRRAGSRGAGTAPARRSATARPHPGGSPRCTRGTGRSAGTRPGRPCPARPPRRTASRPRRAERGDRRGRGRGPRAQHTGAVGIHGGVQRIRRAGRMDHGRRDASLGLDIARR